MLLATQIPSVHLLAYVQFAQYIHTRIEKNCKMHVCMWACNNAQPPMQGQRTHVTQVNLCCNYDTPTMCSEHGKRIWTKYTEDIKGNMHVNGIATNGKYTFWKDLGFEILPLSRIYVVNLSKQAHIVCKECFQFSLPKWCIITIITVRLRMKVFLSGGGMKVGTVVIM